MPDNSLVFTDTKGNEWDLKINLLIAQRVDESDFSALTKLEFSFLSPPKELFQEIYTNTGLSVAIIWAIVQDQVEANLVDPVSERLDQPIETTRTDSSIDWELEFIQCIDGDVLQAARTSLLRALADFFPLHRTVLLQFLNQTKKMEALADLQMKTILPEVGEHMEKEIEEACQKLKQDIEEGKSVSEILGEPSTNPLPPSDGDEIRLPT